jgi:hypothetical protein
VLAPLEFQNSTLTSHRSSFAASRLRYPHNEIINDNTPSTYPCSSKAVLQGPLELGLYTALIFGQRCQQAGIDRSMGARGCALDNAVVEAFFASLKKEKLNRRSWPTREAARNAVFAWIEGWYNRRRLHSTLGYLAPADYENGTLGHGGAGLAASRLAHTSAMIKEKAA